MTSRKPIVVISAVLAPRRSISALVASVVPWDDLADVGRARTGLLARLAQALEDRLLGGGVRGEHLGGGVRVADLEHDVGERAADVDAESRAGRAFVHGFTASPRRWVGRVRARSPNASRQQKNCHSHRTLDNYLEHRRGGAAAGSGGDGRRGGHRGGDSRSSQRLRTTTI